MATTQWKRYAALVPIAGLALCIGGPAGAAPPGTTVGGPRHTCTVVGTAGNDRLSGTTRNDVICGLGGNDVIIGGTGNDIIDGGAGNDTITAGAGNDTIGGGTGDDTIAAGTGDDIVGGGDGRDTVRAEAGNDTVSGGPDNDRIDPGVGNDTATGDRGNDWIDGGWGNDWIDGGYGADDIEGGNGVNTCRRDTADISLPTSCTDLQAPVLHVDTARLASITSVFVDDSWKTIRIHMRLTDDRSGIRGAWISIASGQDQPPVTLRLGRLMSGTANDGVFEFYADMPKWGPVGEYRILDAGVDDWANHRTTVAGSADSPTFTVTGEHDKEPPAFDQASFQWLNPMTFDNTLDRALRLRVRITDDAAGVAEAVATVVAGNGRRVTLRDAGRVSGTKLDGVWELTGDLPAYLPPGEWRLDTISALDGSLRRGETGGVDLTVAPLVVTGSTFDVGAPAAVASSLRWLTPARTADARSTYPRLSIRLTDDLAGVARCTIGLATTASPDDLYMLATSTLVAGSATDGTWEVRGAIPASLPASTTFVRRLELVDGVGHRTSITLPPPPSR